MKTLYCTLITALLAVAPASMSAQDAGQQQSIKQERNYIYKGNQLYREKRFSEAEVMYRKALEVAPTSEAATFNLASSLLRQSGSADPNSGNNPMNDAASMFQQLAQSAKDVNIVEKSFYNLGNMAFNQQNYQQSIEMYKNALRRNPDNDKTRENLRLAQIKLKEQQQNQDKNQNQDQNKDQDKNQDKNQNQDKNKDQNKDQNQDQNQNQQQQDKNKPQQQPQEQTGISDASAQQILKAMENEEAATRKRVETQKKKESQARKKRITNPW